MAQDGVYVFPGEGAGQARSGVDPNLLLALNQNGGFGGGASWLWPMFMWMMFPWMFGGGFGGGFGGFGGGANLLGTGFLSNQLNNNQGTDLLLQAINGNASAASQIAQLTNSNVDRVNENVSAIRTAIASLEGTTAGGGEQCISNSVSGYASLSRQFCVWC